MKKLYWYKICPFCQQGRLFVFKNLDLNKLYLHCEECERGYYEPEHLDVEHSFLTLQESFESVEASEDDIKRFGWQDLNLNTISKL